MTIIAEGQLIAGKIRLERPLAKGGMGSVWIAHHLKLDTPVAVKFMASALAASETARTRFEREARASAQLRSPHVAQVHDYGVEGDTPYIVMELLHGEDLAARLDKRKRLGVAEATRIAVPITKALRRAHEAGLVHRDLKPANVFLAREGDDGGEGDEIVKLLDFGIAKNILPGTLEAGDVTRSGNLVGSPLYMSPEQIRKSKEVDHRSDLWSLGVILYEMLTGRPPFVEDEVGAVLVAICTDPITPPSSLVPALGPAVDRFFETALARDPARRFQSAREMANALAALPSTSETSAAIATSAADTASESRDSLGHADTVPLAGAPGTLTLSPSGRTRDATADTAEKKQRTRRAWIAVAALSLTAVGVFFAMGNAPPGDRVSEKDPGSPTLPLPPPSGEPVALAPLDKPGLDKPQAPEPTPAPVKTVAEARPSRLSKPPAALASSKVAAEAPRAPATSDEDELGLDKPKTSPPGP